MTHHNIMLGMCLFRPQNFTVYTAISIDAEVEEFRRRGWKCQKAYVMQNGIAMSRDLMSYKFLFETDCTELIMWDDDVSCQQGAACRLIDIDEDVVGGMYPMRYDPIKFPVGAEDQFEVRPDGLIISPRILGGFVKIRRAAMQKMWDHAKPYRHGKNAWRAIWDDSIQPDGTRTSEDIGFSRDWRKLGGKLIVDPNINFKHHGHKAFEGNFAQWLGENYHAEPKEEAA